MKISLWNSAVLSIKENKFIEFCSSKILMKISLWNSAVGILQFKNINENKFMEFRRQFRRSEILMKISQLKMYIHEIEC